LLRVEAGELALYEKFWQRWSEYSLEGRLVKAESPDVLKELRKACDKYKLGSASVRKDFSTSKPQTAAACISRMLI